MQILIQSRQWFGSCLVHGDSYNYVCIKLPAVYLTNGHINNNNSKSNDNKFNNVIILKLINIHTLANDKLRVYICTHTHT